MARCTESFRIGVKLIHVFEWLFFCVCPHLTASPCARLPEDVSGSENC